MSALKFRLAGDHDRPAIYAIRHRVYAEELGQHKTNEAHRLTDDLDTANLYVVAERDGDLVGFVSLTRPGSPRFSVDKYVARDAFGFPFDQTVWEVRLLTVIASERRRFVGHLLMVAALEVMVAKGGQRVVAIGRTEVMALYREAGLQPLGRTVTSGAVAFELMVGETATLTKRVAWFRSVAPEVFAGVQWDLVAPGPATHGGRYFDVLGAGLDALVPRPDAVPGDVLDAWFDPAPQVIAAVARDAGWSVKTSPPTHAHGVLAALAAARGVAPDSLLLGAGSSALIYLAMLVLVKPGARVLLLDPTYGEYEHALRLRGCRIERLRLRHEDGFAVPVDDLEQAAAAGYDWIFLVNPNNPTGTAVEPSALEAWLARVPDSTNVWVDETYIDYASKARSVERLAVRRPNVIVCKSLSKAYALSGIRAGYLCAAPARIAELAAWSAPWAMSMPAQKAVMAAVGAPTYYRQRWTETRELATALSSELRGLGLDVCGGEANFLLCKLGAEHPAAPEVVSSCEQAKVFLRTTAGMGTLGDRFLRVAVRSAAENARVVAVLQEKLARPSPNP